MTTLTDWFNSGWSVPSRLPPVTRTYRLSFDAMHYFGILDDKRYYIHEIRIAEPTLTKWFDTRHFFASIHSRRTFA